MLDTNLQTAVAISDYAIIVDEADDVAVVKNETSENPALLLPNGKTVMVKQAVPLGHRFATRVIAAGDFVCQYGQPIGTSLGIEAGEWVTHENMSDDVPVVRDLPEDLHTPAPDYFEAEEIETFMGFRRPDGRIGTRNFILIVPTSMCVSHEASQISMMSEFLHYKRETYPNVDGVVAIPHNKGCGCQDGSNLDIMLRTLSNYAAHPNVGGVVLMDLGCEKTNLAKVEKYLLKRELSFNKPVAKIGIQEIGGTQAAIERGLKIVEEMLPQVNQATREEFPVSELVLGVKCGSSDGFSGISANPALGRAADILVRSNGTVLITEVPEFCGAEHILANRAKNAETGRAIYQMIDCFKDYASKFGGNLNNNPSPGNIASGLLNITIKSLGALAKSAVIKLSSNNRIFEKMKRDIDVSAGNIIEGTETIEDVGKRLFEHIRRVASGDVLAKAEENKHRVRRYV